MRLIDADYVIETLEDLSGDGIETALEVVVFAPTITPKEKVGRWRGETDGSHGLKKQMCSCCKNLSIVRYPYCPWCGAKMEEGANETD